MSGFIVSEEPLPSGEFGYCSYNKQIVISDSLGDTQKLATLNHEFAHGLLHLASDLPSAVEEFEVESVALIMQQRLGLPVEDLTVRYVKMRSVKLEICPNLVWKKALDALSNKPIMSVTDWNCSSFSNRK